MTGAVVGGAEVAESRLAPASFDAAPGHRLPRRRRVEAVQVASGGQVGEHRLHDSPTLQHLTPLGSAVILRAVC